MEHNTRFPTDEKMLFSHRSTAAVPPPNDLLTPLTTVETDISRIIRAEVLAAVHHQVRTTPNNPQKQNPAPKSEKDYDLEAQRHRPLVSIARKSLRESCMDHIRGVLGLAAILVLFTLWMLLLATGLDPMRFSLLALFLLFSVCVFLGLVGSSFLSGHDIQ